ncbi:hypothetical protein [Pseudanabaena sp. PCC 6802]|nr:hypothetical protein [Pseudanabaena sp. PCC 6802]
MWRDTVEVQAELAAILDKTIGPSSSERYQSAQEVMDALKTL